MKLKEFLRINLLKSIWFNYRYLPLKKAWKLPVFIYPHTKVLPSSGEILLAEKVRIGMVKFGRAEAVCTIGELTCLQVNGTLRLDGKASFGCGCTIYVAEGAEMHVGDRFLCSGGSSFLCRKKISLGTDSGVSWDSLLMDTDFHPIKDQAQNEINHDAPITVGAHVWVGCRCTILKGVNISDNTIIAAGTSLVKDVEEPGCIVGQNIERRKLRSDISWRL